MKIKNIIWFIPYINNKWKLKILFDLLLILIKIWILKILFDLAYLVLINEN